MPSDEELLHAFAGGKRDALGALADRYEQPLLNLACAVLGSKDLAVDAVQETWLRVIRHAGSFNGRSLVKTWLYRIAINQCRSQLSASSMSAPAVAAEETGGVQQGNAVLSAQPERTEVADPADVAVRRDEAERLKQAVEQLSPPLREAIVLCYTHGLTHEEAAEVLNVPLGTVKSRVHAALEQLRRVIARPGGGGAP